MPARTLITNLARDVRTVGLTPSIAATAVELVEAFSKDPGDRLIYVTAVEHGWQLVTRDRRLRDHDLEGAIKVW